MLKVLLERKSLFTFGDSMVKGLFNKIIAGIVLVGIVLLIVGAWVTITEEQYRIDKANADYEKRYVHASAYPAEFKCLENLTEEEKAEIGNWTAEYMAMNMRSDKTYRCDEANDVLKGMQILLTGNILSIIGLSLRSIGKWKRTKA